MAFTENELKDLRDLGVKIPKAIEDAEAVLRAVRERNADRSELATVTKLRTVAPKDVDKALDEIAEAYNRKTALQAYATAAQKEAQGRLDRAWAEGRPGVLDDMQAALADTVKEINELTSRVPLNVAVDLNATTNAEALADAARLRVLAAGLAKPALLTGPYVRAVAQERNLTFGKVEFTLIRFTDVPTEFDRLWNFQRTLKQGNGYLDVLSPAGLVALRGAGAQLALHPVAEQVSRLEAVAKSRQGFEVVGGKVLRKDPTDAAWRAARDATW